MSSSAYYYQRMLACTSEKEDYEEDLAKLGQLSSIASDTQSIIGSVRSELSGGISGMLSQNWSGNKARMHQGNIGDLAGKSNSINSDLSDLRSKIDAKKRECNEAIDKLNHDISMYRELYYEALEEERAERNQIN